MLADEPTTQDDMDMLLSQMPEDCEDNYQAEDCGNYLSSGRDK